MLPLSGIGQVSGKYRMDTVKEQMEHHLSAGADSMAHFYIPCWVVC